MAAAFKSPFPLTSGTSAAGDPLEQTHHRPGEVHVIVGPMFAGKTTDLLRRIKSASSSGRKVAIIKSSKDNRYAVDSVVSHDGLKFPCWSMPDLISFEEQIGDEAYRKIDVIGIDEAQFFDDLYDFCCKAADQEGKTVIVAGLDGDYLRWVGGDLGVLDVIPLADTVTKLTARCEMCGKRALFTLRKTTETRVELVGGSDMYMPVCRQHYVDLKVVKEAVKSVSVVDLDCCKIPGEKSCTEMAAAAAVIM